MPTLATVVVEYIADTSGLQVGVTAAADAMVELGGAADVSNGYLASLGDTAFTTGAGFDGMTASAAALDESLATVDASLTSVGASADVATSSFADMYGVVDLGAMSFEEFNAYTAEANIALGIWTDETNVAALSTDNLATSLAAASVSAGGAATSFDALSIAEEAAATAGDAIEASLAVVGTALAVVGIGAGIAGAVSAKMAGDFQQSMTQLVTGAGEAQSNLQMVSDGILNMAPAVGSSTKDLAAGMYMIESAGQHGTQALETLKDAAEGAKVGSASLADVANGVTTEMTDYASSGLTASQATNTLIATVSEGKTHMADLSNAMATILPTASSVGISLKDVSGAMATMTSEGVPAADAATYLRQTIMQIENPTKKAADEMAAMGLKSATVADEMKTSLPNALQMITDAAAKKFPVGSTQYNDAVATMAGGTKSLQGMLDLTGSHLDTFKGNVTGIADAVDKGGNSIQGLGKVQEDFNFKLDQAKATAEKWGIQIGEKLLPILGKLLDAFTSPGFQQFASSTGQAISKAFDDISNFVTPLAPKFLDIANNFGKVTDAFKNPAFGNLAKELGGDLKTGITWLVNALASPQFGQFAHIVGVVIAGAILFAVPIIRDIAKNIIQFAEDIATRLKPGIDAFLLAWNAMWPQTIDTLQGAWDMIKGIIQIAWSLVSGIIKIGLDILFGNWGTAWNDMKDMLKGVWDGIQSFVKGAIEALVGAFRPMLEGMSHIPGPAGDMARNVLNSFDSMQKGANDSAKQMKIQTVQHTIDMQNSMIKSIDDTRQQLIQKMIETKDPVAKHALEMQLQVTEQMEKMHVNAKNKATDMKNDLVGHSIIPDMVSSIGDWFNKLPGMALDAGTNICKSIGTGITNAIHFVTDAMTNVTSWISSHLPHSPAKVGPLVDLQQQGMEISNQIAQGMVNGTPLISSAIGNMTKPVTVGLKGAASTSSTPLQGGGQQIVIQNQIFLDGKEVTNQVMTRAQKETRRGPIR